LKSAEGGNLEGIKNLAVLLKDGIGQKADPAEAMRWYLTLQKSGVKDQGLEEVIADLRKSLTEAQLKKAEAAAAQWLEAREKREGGQRL
jgi:hypothetical protein